MSQLAPSLVDLAGQVDNFTPPFDLAGRRIGEASFVLPDDLPLGCHRVHLRSGDEESSAALIVTPACETTC